MSQPASRASNRLTRLIAVHSVQTSVGPAELVITVTTKDGAVEAHIDEPVSLQDELPMMVLRRFSEVVAWHQPAAVRISACRVADEIRSYEDSFPSITLVDGTDPIARKLGAEVRARAAEWAGENAAHLRELAKAQATRKKFEDALVKPLVVVATDGSVGRGNPQGAWAWIDSLGGGNGDLYTGDIVECELWAIIRAIRSHPNTRMRIITDSQVSVDLVEARLSPQARREREQGKEPVDMPGVSRDASALADKAARAIEKHVGVVSLEWVRSHAAKPENLAEYMNEGADTAAVLVRRRLSDPQLANREDVRARVRTVASATIANYRRSL
ncbi:MAG: hypothetical protein QP744_03885 [Winkia sp. UMB750A]|uniref:ribonuclease HI n=1 Tax=Winkia TaxID=2692118 RepID=UPI0023A94F59|nr:MULTISPECIES: RNase H family protein [Winkia]MDK7905962.1 hypothetical protein [Winkia sp. UMB0889B]MDK8225149.1 hypothetical protein [Winkia sp. UMB750B]MDK8256603.1 hypothetical protein [Winkia sp. UMB750A]WEB72616.1 hypothetical protein PUW51_09860 [Winkia neuii]